MAVDVMDPCDTSLVGKGFFNATSNFRNMVRSMPTIFNPSAVGAIQAAIECFPPKILAGRANSYLRPLSIERCVNRTGYKDFAGVFYPHVWRKISAVRRARLKKCRPLGHMLTALNCLGYDLEVSLALIREGRMKTDYDGLVQMMGRPLKRWVAKWPNESSLVVLTSGSGRLFHPALQGQHARKATLVTYAGSSEWLTSNFAFHFTLGIARELNVSRRGPTSHCGAGYPKESRALGRMYYYYPDIWKNDVTIQYPCSYDSKKHWRGPHGRSWLASFVGSPTHCSRQDLLERWQGREGSRIKVIPTVYTEGLYSEILQKSRYCLVLDGHYPWTIRYLDVLQHGCVPVVVSLSWHPPLHRLLDWQSAIDGRGFPTILLHPDLVPSLDVILAAIDEGLWLRMQDATLNLARLLDPRCLCMLLGCCWGCRMAGVRLYSWTPNAILAEIFLSILSRSSSTS
ncbi:unnamed protein product [Symbiodinium natans]|uniref:Exostosin GT47 domain-containing protein n=1 Tax=Symbiodinium natans TaxID=878477 RepID=A0A812SJJ9_9DINO|nr:unnamed protein product [Symbiodinium natans]